MNSRKIIKKIRFLFLGSLAFFIITSIGLLIYVNQNKPKILAEINEQLSQNINGKLEIQDLKLKFLTGFPNATIALKNVTLKDSLWKNHQKTFIKANEIQVRFNVWNLMHDKINIHKIVINNAAINLFKDKNGYTNAYLLNPKQRQSKNNTKIKEIVLHQVVFNSNNQKEKKIFDFDIQTANAKIKYTDNLITTRIKLKMKVKNMIFKPKNGSFLKNKLVEGNFDLKIFHKENLVELVTTKLKLEKNPFEIKAQINLGKYNSKFNLKIKTTIKWLEIMPLLTPNIYTRLNKIDFKNPNSGTCKIYGEWKKKGNPKIEIYAQVENNELKSPDGTFENCSLEAEFNNNYSDGKGFNDANSVVVFKNFKANFKTIPFEIPLAQIVDLKKPIATGKLKSNFDIKKLNPLINEKLIDCYSGQAKVNFDFKVNIVNLKLNKPTFTGSVLVHNAHLEYVPKKIILNDTDIELNFSQKSLWIKNIKLKQQNNTVFINGKVDDFLYLYYHDSDKIKVNWNVYSPTLEVQSMISMLTKKSNFNKKNKDSFSLKLEKIFDKSQAIINIKVDKITYHDLTVEHLNTTVNTNNDSLKIEKGILKTLGGTINFEGNLNQKKNQFTFNAHTQMQNLDLQQVIKGMNSFGLKSLKTNEITGKLSANATISGVLLPKGDVVRNTISLNINKASITTLGGSIDFDGQLFPKNKLYAFNFNSHVNQINIVAFFETFDNFGMKTLNTKYLNGALSFSANANGLLLPNWHLFNNEFNAILSNGVFKSLDGEISFNTQIKPKNDAFAFTSSTQISDIDLEQFITTFDFFGIKKLEKQKIKGRFSSTVILNGTLLNSGKIAENTINVELKKGWIKSMGGNIDFYGKLITKNNKYNFSSNAKINHVAIDQFLETFDNFGITSFQPKNIMGQLDATASINGFLESNGKFISNSIAGQTSINITNGSLEDFEPINNVWRYIFPFRDFKNITFSSITGNLKINGDKVNVNDFKVNSNVMNFDMNGVYAFKKGTHLALTVPLRNPKKDIKINDEIVKKEKRDNGIILHLIATDGDNGKIKIKLGKKK
jgi:hypothetical protein